MIPRRELIPLSLATPDGRLQISDIGWGVVYHKQKLMGGRGLGPKVMGEGVLKSDWGKGVLCQKVMGRGSD